MMLSALLSAALTLATPVTTVPPRLQTISSAQLVAVATAAVKTHLGTAYTRVSLRVIGRPGALTVPWGTTTLKAGPLVGPWPRARVCVPVRVLLAGHAPQSAAVWFALKAYAPTLTFSAAATRGTPAAALTLRHAIVNVAHASAPPLMNLEALKGMQLRRAVRAAQIVTLRDFEPIPDVGAQQRVRILVTYGAIHIDATGTALASGMKGATVPIILAGGHRPFRAEITGKGVVAIEH